MNSNNTAMSEQFNQVIEHFRSENSRPRLIAQLVHPNGAAFVSARRNNGGEFHLKGYANPEGAIVLSLSHEALAAGISYDVDGITFGTRFSGENVTVHVPYVCMGYMTGLDAQGRDTIMELTHRAAAEDDFPAIPVNMVMEIVRYMNETRPGVPCIIDVKIDGTHTYQHLSVDSFNDRGGFSVSMGLIEPVEFYLDNSNDTGDRLIFDNPLASGPQTAVIVNVFSPGPDFTYMVTPGGLRIMDPGLAERLNAVWEKDHPMVDVTLTDEMADAAINDANRTMELVAASEPTEGQLCVVEVGETTEVTQGNVTAVDFRKRTALK